MTFQSRWSEFELATFYTELAGLTLPARLAAIGRHFPGRLVLTTSFGLEDQALTHAAVLSGVPLEFATLDTGRLFDETLELWARTEMQYQIRIRSYVPAARAAEDLLADQGPFGFRDSVEARKECCAVRKVEPLGRALQGASGWITGLRADQSDTRAATPFLVHDPSRHVTKINPLADWSRDAVVDYVRANSVPYNPLHDRGFLSIGCAPCTRAVAPGEPERAGRWWWEDETRKECGLHNRPGAARAVLPTPALG